MTETFHGFVDTAFDALLLFDACCDGRLPRVPRRFGDRERQTIQSGAVYVWDEEETGMRRWTDGRTWSPSRVNGCFLIYYELEGRRHQFVSRDGHGAARRGRRSPLVASVGPSSLFASYDPCPPNVVQKEQGLVKKALSLCTGNKRRLHLVCYYSREDVDSGRLVTPSNDPMFAGMNIQEERYPELANGLGRFDRYGSNRSRMTGGSQQWKVASPESAARRDGAAPPACLPMAAETRPNPYAHLPYDHPHAGPGAASMPPPLSLQPPQQQHLLPPAPPPPPQRARMYDVPSPGATAADSPRPSGSEYCLVMPAVSMPMAPYIRHTHVYSTEAHPAMAPKQHPQQQQQQHRWQQQPLPPHIVHSQAPAMPVWQHSEAPQAYYDTPPHGSPRRASHAPAAEATWQSAGCRGLAIQTVNGGAPLFGQPQQPLSVVAAVHQPVLTLPPIARLDSRPASTDGWAKGSESAARMTSEDMRQLAALRLSLH